MCINMVMEIVVPITLGFLLYFNIIYNPWLKLPEFVRKYPKFALREIKQLVLIVHLLSVLIIVIKL